MNAFRHVDRHPEFDDHAMVAFIGDKKTGLRSIIAVHRAFLNPHSRISQSLGGIRMMPYKNDGAALTDVLRLSKGMSYKAALAGVPFGGAKSVIMGDPVIDREKKEVLLASFARHLRELRGLYVGAEDMGMKEADMDFIRKQTRWVVGVSEKMNGSGDPSRMTALGVYESIQVCFKKLFGDPSVFGRKVAVQGVGNVGRNLSIRLLENGAHVIIADTNETRLRDVGDTLFEKMHGHHMGTFSIVEPEEIHMQDVDAYAPCAGGAVLNDETIPLLRCPIVAGSANNQLAETRHGGMLHEKGILYAPDYVVNAGGLINVAMEMEPAGYDETTAHDKVLHIRETLQKILERSDAERRPPYLVANDMAEEVIEQMRV